MVDERTLAFELAGELDLSNAPALTDGLSTALDVAMSGDPSPARMVLDLQNLTFIDSAGIEALLATKRRCAESGAGFALRLGSSRIRRTLTVVGITDLLEIGGEIQTARLG